MMQSLSFSQLKSFAKFLRLNLLGAQLQNVWTNGEIVFLEIYLRDEYIIAIDTSLQIPMIAVLMGLSKQKKQTKPVTLFLNSHAVNLRLTEVSVEALWGRVIRLGFSGGDRSCTLDVQLIPRAFNLTVTATTDSGEAKKISWAKPKELPPSTAKDEGDFAETDWLEYGAKWWNEKTSTSSQKQRSKVNSEGPEQAVQKKQKVLASLRQNLESEVSVEVIENWKKLGELLKYQTLDQLSDPLQRLAKKDLSAAENRDRAFANAKAIAKKRDIILSRLAALEAEIAAAESGGLVQQKTISQKKGLLEQSSAKGRRLRFNDQFEAVIGKSGQDNLAILRKSQAWDLWIHLKDFPGAHAIISRPRNKEVPLEILEQVAQWVIKESFSNKKIDLGQKYDVLVVETRFVRPIKGDKLGRVTFTNGKVYSFSSMTRKASH